MKKYFFAAIALAFITPFSTTIAQTKQEAVKKLSEREAKNLIKGVEESLYKACAVSMRLKSKRLTLEHECDTMGNYYNLLATSYNSLEDIKVGEYVYHKSTKELYWRKAKVDSSFINEAITNNIIHLSQVSNFHSQGLYDLKGKKSQVFLGESAELPMYLTFRSYFPHTSSAITVRYWFALDTPQLIRIEYGVKVGDTNTNSDYLSLVFDFKDIDLSRIKNPNLTTAFNLATDSDSIYNQVPIKPVYREGEIELMNMLARQIRYPAEARENRIEGRVNVSFVVEKDGSISNVKAEEQLAGGLSEEAVRVALFMPYWEAGKIGDEPKRVRMILPIIFKVE